jgi:S-disulfanyl-L-cysteine oxidoreductase SoxD
MLDEALATVHKSGEHRWTIVVGPDADGLLPGRGIVAEGEKAYLAKCAACHEPTGTEGPMDRLVGGKLPVKIISSYWPYATTILRQSQ